ncbi:MAG: sulfotransferase family protein [Bacteroidetes bacterium]|nr:sulfotransferase family protein [Bacteroidota bacterium]
MLSINRKFLFIHVPKTAGNSIQNILQHYSEDEIVAIADHHDGIERFEVRNKKYSYRKHSNLSHYRSILDPEIYKSLYKFAVVRNPWDRMISYYFSPNRGVVTWDRKSFLSLLKSVTPVRQYIIEQPLLDRALLKIGLERPNARKKKLDSDIDYIMKFERLGEDFKILCEHLKIPYIPIPRRNASSREHYSEYYDQELIELVRVKYSDEIEFGNYKFETI